MGSCQSQPDAKSSSSRAVPSSRRHGKSGRSEARLQQEGNRPSRANNHVPSKHSRQHQQIAVTSPSQSPSAATETTSMSASTTRIMSTSTATTTSTSTTKATTAATAANSVQVSKFVPVPSQESAPPLCVQSHVQPQAQSQTQAQVQAPIQRQLPLPPPLASTPAPATTAATTTITKHQQQPKVRQKPPQRNRKPKSSSAKQSRQTGIDPLPTAEPVVTTITTTSHSVAVDPPPTRQAVIRKSPAIVGSARTALSPVQTNAPSSHSSPRTPDKKKPQLRKQSPKLSQKKTMVIKQMQSPSKQAPSQTTVAATTCTTMSSSCPLEHNNASVNTSTDSTSSTAHASSSSHPRRTMYRTISPRVVAPISQSQRSNFDSSFSGDSEYSMSINCDDEDDSTTIPSSSARSLRMLQQPRSPLSSSRHNGQDNNNDSNSSRSPLRVHANPSNPTGRRVSHHDGQRRRQQAQQQQGQGQEANSASASPAPPPVQPPLHSQNTLHREQSESSYEEVTLSDSEGDGSNKADKNVNAAISPAPSSVGGLSMSSSELSYEEQVIDEEEYEQHACIQKQQERAYHQFLQQQQQDATNLLPSVNDDTSYDEVTLEEDNVSYEVVTLESDDGDESRDCPRASDDSGRKPAKRLDSNHPRESDDSQALSAHSAAVGSAGQTQQHDLMHASLSSQHSNQSESATTSTSYTLKKQPPRSLIEKLTSPASAERKVVSFPVNSSGAAKASSNSCDLLSMWDDNDVGNGGSDDDFDASYHMKWSAKFSMASDEGDDEHDFKAAADVDRETGEATPDPVATDAVDDDDNNVAEAEQQSVEEESDESLVQKALGIDLENGHCLRHPNQFITVHPFGKDGDLSKSSAASYPSACSVEAYPSMNVCRICSSEQVSGSRQRKSMARIIVDIQQLQSNKKEWSEKTQILNWGKANDEGSDGDGPTDLVSDERQRTISEAEWGKEMALRMAQVHAWKESDLLIPRPRKDQQSSTASRPQLKRRGSIAMLRIDEKELPNLIKRVRSLLKKQHLMIVGERGGDENKEEGKAEASNGVTDAVVPTATLTMNAAEKSKEVSVEEDAKNIPDGKTAIKPSKKSKKLSAHLNDHTGMQLEVDTAVDNISPLTEAKCFVKMAKNHKDVAGIAIPDLASLPSADQAKDGVVDTVQDPPESRSSEHGRGRSAESAKSSNVSAAVSAAPTESTTALDSTASASCIPKDSSRDSPRKSKSRTSKSKKHTRRSSSKSSSLKKSKKSRKASKTSARRSSISGDSSRKHRPSLPSVAEVPGSPLPKVSGHGTRQRVVSPRTLGERQSSQRIQFSSQTLPSDVTSELGEADGITPIVLSDPKSQNSLRSGESSGSSEVIVMINDELQETTTSGRSRSSLPSAVSSKKASKAKSSKKKKKSSGSQGKDTSELAKGKSRSKHTTDSTEGRTRTRSSKRHKGAKGSKRSSSAKLKSRKRDRSSKT